MRASRHGSLESIKAVRAEVNASVADCRAALAKTGGHVDAAIDTLKTPEDRIRDRAPTLPPQNPAKQIRTPRARTPSNEKVAAKVLPDFERALAAMKAERPSVWVGDPDAAALAQLESKFMSAFGRPMPDALRRFLTVWNGYDDGASTSVLWACTDHDHSSTRQDARHSPRTGEAQHSERRSHSAAALRSLRVRVRMRASWSRATMSPKSRPATTRR